MARLLGRWPQGVAFEIFSGQGVFARAWRSDPRVRHIPIFEVDLKHGAAHNMLAGKELKALRGLLRAGVVRALWLGTPCTSFSRAREIPNWPNAMPIRSSEHPEGQPGLPPRLQLQVDVGNRLARSSAQIMELVRQLGVPAATEGPSTSRMWSLD